MTKKVLDRKIGQDQSVPNDLLMRVRIRRNGAFHEPHVRTAKGYLQITDIISVQTSPFSSVFRRLFGAERFANPHELCLFPNRLRRTGRSEHSGARTAREDGSVSAKPLGREGLIRHSIPGWSDDGASHRMNCDTPPLKGLRLEPFGSVRNHCEESMRCALSRFHAEPEFFE